MPFLHGVELLEITSGTRPIQVAPTSVIGLIGTAPDADAGFPLNTPVLVTNRAEAAGLGTNGTLPDAIDGIYDQAGAVVVVVRIEQGADADDEQTNAVGGYNASTGSYTGVHAFLAAQSILEVSPRILIAPGLTGYRPGGTDANPTTAELISIADKLRAVIFADGPNTGDTDVITWTGDHDSARLMVVDPYVKVQRTGGLSTVPASPLAAGALARSDYERGFWWSPSNTVLRGVLNTARPIDFKMGDATARANILNENGITTIIRHEGFRLWGNRSVSSDTKWIFLSVRRTADIINDSILKGHLWAVDRNITARYLEEVAEGVNAFLRQLKAQGAILGGSCWPDPELNTPASIALGQVYFNFDFTPPYPAERVTFRSLLTQDYIEEIL
jgi:phage tail sheath protein FI